MTGRVVKGAGEESRQEMGRDQAQVQPPVQESQSSAQAMSATCQTMHVPVSVPPSSQGQMG